MTVGVLILCINSSRKGPHHLERKPFAFFMLLYCLAGFTLYLRFKLVSELTQLYHILDPQKQNACNIGLGNKIQRSR